jgi:Mrp family chromosome partitioning ATPase/capsular polysaccharide biosynthesis protein
MNDTTEARAIFAPLWKRKWLILLAGILVAGGTYLYYKREQPIFAASTQIYLGNGSEEQAPASGGGKREKHKKGASTSGAAGQASLINSPIVRELVNRRLRSEPGPVAAAALRGAASAKAREVSEFIAITAEARSATAAALLANTVAQTYVARQQASYERAIKAAIAVTQGQIRAVELQLAQPAPTANKGSRKTSTTSLTLEAANLTTKLNQYEGQLSVVTVRQYGLAKAALAHLLSPMPKKNAIFGFALGIFLACVAAYFLSRFDRRLQSLTAVEAVFETDILTALPTVKRPLVRRDGQIAPARALSEPLRRLHASLQLLDAGEYDRGDSTENHRERPRRTILFLSPDAGDGSSTVVATLALVQRESDEQVAVLEADFRRPVQARLLGVPATPGLAEVLSGTLALDEAIHVAESIPGELNTNSRGAHRPADTVVATRVAGARSVLVGGIGVPNPPALLASRSMTGLLRSLADEFDYTLIDSPSPLHVSDAMPLLGVVDGIVLVARVGHTREISARRLMQILSRTPSAPILGVVANDVSRGELDRYGFYSTQRRRGWLGGLIGR